MLIYLIPNLVKKTTDYVCDSQATIDNRPNRIEANQCSIGGESEANSLLATNQQAWLTQQASLFTVNLQTVVEDGVVWTVVDLNTEPENTDRQYFVLDPTTGLYTGAVGLDSAKTLFLQTQQTYLVFTNISSYTSKTSWN